MIATDEDALMCDLAETYTIYDYKQLPLQLVAVFAMGLRENSRIKMLMNHQKVETDTLFLAGIFDKVSLLFWAQTKDGQKGTNVPVSLVELLTTTTNQHLDNVAFNSGEEFEKAKQDILKRLEEVDTEWQQN
ncbi:hypothetical protein KG091_07735 [Carnobacteriaceae bacterium zg-ZUI78]|nr:hypothetical protein [Carnobacteriaceae bacterium zg-ZUI78]